ncbi:MAG TPA: hypothetical protein VGF86_04365 [Candidatus Tumulicola sp.]|jgi:hypothetical protein
MGLDATGAPKANGLKTALDTIVAPKEAFEQLRVVPTWGWALLISIVLYALAGYLLTPAMLHAMQADWPRQVAANPRLAELTPDQQQRALTLSLTIVRWVWLITPVIAVIIVLVQSVVMWIFKAIGRGDAPFRALWAASANITVPVLGLSSVITTIIVLVRGPDSFNSQAEVQTAMPSLALLVPASAVKLHAFAAALNPFSIWGCGLTIGAMAIVARVSRAWAWITGIVGLLVAAGLVAMAAR